MARGKVATTKELRDEVATLNKRLHKANTRNTKILERVGGLRAFLLQNDVDQTRVVELLEQVIQDS